ncbi:MAG: polyphenol oxidase family protein [Verrucomicrobiota bacterium]
MSTPIEQFPALTGVEGFLHAFTLRDPDIQVDVDRETALRNLDATHLEAAKAAGINNPLTTGEQVHGNQVAVVRGESPNHIKGVDGLVTIESDRPLGIYVADCAAVYLVDPEKRALGLVHSGKKGTELEITRLAIELMGSEFGCNPANIIAQLSPCIRPCHYEVDFPSAILDQCVKAGLQEQNIHDCGTCTATNVGIYYSYRQEKGKTGRMLAMVGWN